MTLIETAIAITLGLISVIHGISVGIFYLACRRRPRVAAENDLPEVTAIVPVRGCDPTLEKCLHGLIHQDYPKFEVRVIVDNEVDPAWDTIQRVIRSVNNTPAPVQVQSLSGPSPSCGLKCSALLQATADLNQSCEVTVLLDTDVVPHSTWLRELVGPLVDQRYGASTGNRWYIPRDGNWGSMVRRLWNLPAVVSMFVHQVPWGGSLAIRTSLLRHSDLRTRWSRAGCDDVPLFDVLRRCKKRLRFVPSLMMLSVDDCTTTACSRFMTRQFLWVRLYHPVCWWLCSIGQTLAFLVHGLGLLICLAGVAEGRFSELAWLWGSVALYALVSALAIVGLDVQIRNLLSRRTELPPRRWLKTFAAIPLSIAVSVMAIVRASFARRVVWRGIHYQIGGPWKIEMQGYFPYAPTCHDAEGIAPIHEDHATKKDMASAA